MHFDARLQVVAVRRVTGDETRSYSPMGDCVRSLVYESAALRDEGGRGRSLAVRRDYHLARSSGAIRHRTPSSCTPTRGHACCSSVASASRPCGRWRLHSTGAARPACQGRAPHHKVIVLRQKVIAHSVIPETSEIFFKILHRRRPRCRHRQFRRQFRDAYSQASR